MRWIVRTAVAVVVALALVVLLVLDTLVRDLWHKYNVNDFVYSSVAEALRYNLDTYNPTGENNGDKIVIMAKLEAEDTEWVAEKLPESVPPPTPLPAQRVRPATNKIPRSLNIAGNTQSTPSTQPPRPSSAPL